MRGAAASAAKADPAGQVDGDACNGKADAAHRVEAQCAHQNDSGHDQVAAVGKAIFLLWLASIIAVSCVAIRENVGDKFRTKRRVLEQVFQSEIVIDGDTTTLERLLEDYDDESVIEEGRKTLHISVPSKSIDITVDKKQGELRVNADGRKVSVKASETGDEASVTIRRETDAADSAKTTRGSAARSR